LMVDRVVGRRNSTGEGLTAPQAGSRLSRAHLTGRRDSASETPTAHSPRRFANDVACPLTSTCPTDGHASGGGHRPRRLDHSEVVVNDLGNGRSVIGRPKL
jgi:hypothetical protein